MHSEVGGVDCLSKPAIMMIMSGLCSASHAVSSTGLADGLMFGLAVGKLVVVSVREVVSGFLVFHPGSLSL